MAETPLGKRKRANANGGAAVAEPIEQVETISFDRYAESASYILNSKYSRLRCSQQFEKGHDAATQVQKCITAIGKATPARSSYGTKKNALGTLLDIGTDIVDAPGELGREVRKEFEYESCLQRTMLRIAKSMTAEERKAFMTVELTNALVEFEREAAGYCIFKDLEKVRLALLGNLQGTDDEEDEHESCEADESDDEDDEDDEKDGSEDGSEDEDDD